jgi:biopolymer transport protein ExbD
VLFHYKKRIDKNRIIIAVVEVMDIARKSGIKIVTIGTQSPSEKAAP